MITTTLKIRYYINYLLQGCNKHCFNCDDEDDNSDEERVIIKIIMRPIAIVIVIMLMRIVVLTKILNYIK